MFSTISLKEGEARERGRKRTREGERELELENFILQGERERDEVSGQNGSVN